MKLSDALTPSFHSLGCELGLKVEIFEGRLVIIAPMWRKALSTESQFCRALVSCGYLTDKQMRHAARRYRLGATRHGGVIFWQIDDEGDICDGKVMYYREDCHRDKQHHPTWVSTLLTRRHHWADADRLTTRHCLFGLHLLCHTDLTDYTDWLRMHEGHTQSTEKKEICEISEICVTKYPFRDFYDFRVTTTPVCVVESEKSAVILSELFPQYLWLATGGLGNVQPDKFRPLRGRKVILFPDTDPDGKTFKTWYDAAQLVMRQPFWEDSPPITVSPLLELHTTPEQKADKIDLVDYLFKT